MGQPSQETVQYWFDFMWKRGAIQKTIKEEKKKSTKEIKYDDHTNTK